MGATILEKEGKANTSNRRRRRRRRKGGGELISHSHAELSLVNYADYEIIDIPSPMLAVTRLQGGIPTIQSLKGVGLKHSFSFSL